MARDQEARSNPGFSYFAGASRVSSMPVCNKCNKFSNVLTVDVCEHCGAKDWEESRHDKTLREHGERYAKMTPAQRAQSSRSLVSHNSNDLASKSGRRTNSIRAITKFIKTRRITRTASVIDLCGKMGV